MDISKTDKSFRLLQLHERLSRGERIIKDKALTEFGVPPKTFQRDIECLRFYYAEHNYGDLIYDRKANCYRLASRADTLTRQEVFAVCKVLIESRAFNKEEFDAIITKLLRQCVTDEADAVKSLIANEQVNYLPLKHGKPLVDLLWTLAGLISEQRLTRIWYVRQDKTPKEHIIMPVGIMFSEFYFYLIAGLANDAKDSYTVFRVDRVTDIKAKDELFDVPYADRFSEAEFRKRVQFMYSGKLKRVTFIYRGTSLEAVFDRLPTAKVVNKHNDGSVTLTAESYGDGIDMWLKSQGDWVEIVG